MQQVDRGIFYEDGYLGVTLGGLVFSHGTIMIDAPLRPEDARAWRSALLKQRGWSGPVVFTAEYSDHSVVDRAAMDDLQYGRELLEG